MHPYRCVCGCASPPLPSSAETSGFLPPLQVLHYGLYFFLHFIPSLGDFFWPITLYNIHYIDYTYIHISSPRPFPELLTAQLPLGQPPGMCDRHLTTQPPIYTETSIPVTSPSQECCVSKWRKHILKTHNHVQCCLWTTFICEQDLRTLLPQGSLLLSAP